MTKAATAYDFLLLAYSAFEGTIRGRTYLQKSLYFLGLMMKDKGLFEFDQMGYDAHYYGPYSPIVDSTNNEFISLGYLDQSQYHTGMIDSRGFEVARFDYRLTDRGTRLAEAAKKEYPDLWRLLQGAVEKITSSGLDYMELSIAAKAYFLLTSTYLT